MTNIDNQLAQLLQSSDLTVAKKAADAINVSLLDNIKLLVLGAMVYRKLGVPSKAAQFSFKAMLMQPENYTLAIAYSEDLMRLGKIDAAEMALEKIQRDQHKQTPVQLQKSKICYLKHDFSSAEFILKDIIKQHPDFAVAHLELAHTLLMQGKWEDGWREYEWRYRLPTTEKLLPKFKMPHWNGEKNTPHILLIADQGYGDSFQFSRYLPLVAQRCEKITLMRSEPLARIMDSCPWVTSSHSRWEDTPLASAYCTLSGLPKIFSTTLDTIPPCSGILQSDPKDLARWKERLGKSGKQPVFRVGIVWSGRTEYKGNYFRSLPFEQFEKMLGIPDVEFFSLQVGSPLSQANLTNITDLSNELTDFAETAAAIQALDLIITSDTSVAHLSGTLGKTTWVLLSHAPDWRWGYEGTSTPWYPTLRLFRQDKTRNWQTVINECIENLKQIILSKTIP